MIYGSGTVDFGKAACGIFFNVVASGLSLRPL